jgi:hypothetical protein
MWVPALRRACSPSSFSLHVHVNQESSVTARLAEKEKKD